MLIQASAAVERDAELVEAQLYRGEALVLEGQQSKDAAKIEEGTAALSKALELSSARKESSQEDVTALQNKLFRARKIGFLMRLQLAKGLEDAKTKDLKKKMGKYDNLQKIYKVQPQINTKAFFE